MNLDRSKKSAIVGVAFLVLLTIVVAACGGSGGTAATGGSTGATPTCPANPFKTATGVLQSISGTSLLVHSAQGSDIKASYATTTRIQQETTTTSAALKAGIFVTIAVKQDSSGNYTATTITLVANRGGGQGGSGGFGGFGGRNGTPGAFGGRNGTPGAFGGRNGTPGANAGCFRQGFAGGAATPAAGGSSVTGSVGQLNGDSLTVTDTQGSNYVVTLNAATKIIQFQTATASALKSGANLTITGADNGKGVITAQSILILLPGSTSSSAA